jgi:hypothetical protein
LRAVVCLTEAEQSQLDDHGVCRLGNLDGFKRVWPPSTTKASDDAATGSAIRNETVGPVDGAGGR